jgi:hypothetical protein
MGNHSKRAELRQDKIARGRLDSSAQLQNYLTAKIEILWPKRLKKP